MSPFGFIMTGFEDTSEVDVDGDGVTDYIMDKKKIKDNESIQTVSDKCRRS